MLVEVDELKERILEATRIVLSEMGPRRLRLSDVAAVAEVSRPALYRRFPSKEDLLAELAYRERQEFDDGLRVATAGLSGTDRLDAALRFIVVFQRTYSLRRLIDVEPEYVLEQMALAFPVLRDRLLQYFPAATSDVQASSITRIAFCHFVLPDDDPDRLLAELRQAAGIRTRR